MVKMTNLEFLIEILYICKCIFRETRTIVSKIYKQKFVFLILSKNVSCFFAINFIFQSSVVLVLNAWKIETQIHYTWKKFYFL